MPTRLHWTWLKTGRSLNMECETVDGVTMFYWDEPDPESPPAVHITIGDELALADDFGNPTALVTVLNCSRNGNFLRITAKA